MGVTMGFVTDTGVDPPLWFTRTDSKELWGQLIEHHSYSSGALHKLLQHFGLDMKPFWNYSGEEYSLEGWMALNLPALLDY